MMVQILVLTALAAQVAFSQQQCIATVYNPGTNRFDCINLVYDPVTHVLSPPVGVTLSNGLAWVEASQFAGADASIKINSCLATVASAGGGTCDASAMGGSSLQLLTQTISVGTQGMEASGGTVTLLLPDKARWAWDLRDGTSCGIKQYSSSSVIGSQPGGTWSGVVLQPGSSSTSMDSLYCTDPTPDAGAAYIRAEGFTAVNNIAGASFASGVIHINPLYDESSFERILGRNPTGDAWHIDNPCCGVKFDNIQGYGGGNGITTAGYPLLIKGGRAFSITNSTFNGAGTGKNNIKIGGSTPQDITFINTYMEKYITDNTVPMVSIGSDAYNVYFLNGYALTSCSSPCSQVIFENNTTQGFTAEHFGIDFHTTSAVHDVANNRSFASDGFTLDRYSVGPSTASSYTQALATNTLSILSPNGILPSISGTSTFTPSGVGWYRVISSNYGSNGRPFVSGTMDIFTEFGFDNVSALSVDFRVGAFNAPGILTARTFGVYGGNYGPIDQIKVSGDGASLLYVDVHISTITSVSPISIVFYGQGILSSVIVPTPVVGATPGASSVASLDFSTNDGTFSLFTSGAVVSSGIRSNTGGAASRAMCFKADGKTVGVCSTVVASDGTCTCN